MHASILISGLLSAIRRDRANRYALRKPWTLPRLADPVPDYAGKLIRIQDRVVTVHPYAGDVNDGCTLVPDYIGAWRPVVGAVFHDPWYLEMDAMAAAWGWPVARVRRLGDRVFYAILVHVSSTGLARIYYRGVRMFGGLAHFFGQRMPLVVALLLLGSAGCSGCIGPGQPFEDPSDLTLPDYDQTAFSGSDLAPV